MDKLHITPLIFSLVLFIPLVVGGYHQDRILLSDIKTLTLRQGHKTTGRRSSPVPQLQCVGGTAGCNKFVPQVVQCYNRGSDGVDIQWECKADMDNAYRFGEVEVSCEGYDYPDDMYVLKGSCGLEYTLDLTKEGYEQERSGYSGYSGHYDKHYHDDSHNYYGGGSKRKSKTGFGDIIMLGIVGLIIYGIYKTCISSGSANRSNSTDYPHQSGYNQQGPPPPGFRSEYMPGHDHHKDSSYTTTNGLGGSGLGEGFGSGTQGRFWTGAVAGGILGYLFGGRNNNNAYGQQRSWFGNTHGNTGSSWFGNSNNRNTGSSWFGSSSSTGSRSSGSSSSSTGTRTASGFGGTKRR